MLFNLPEKLSFVDLETTGGSPSTGGRIIDIGIIRVENGKMVSEYNQLINPETQIPIFVQRMTGIYEEDVWNMPTFSQVKNDVLEILKDTVFVAHNVKFDYGFLKEEFAHEEIDFKMSYFCSAKLSRYLFSEEKSHKLDSIMERFDIECEARHRAFGDAQVVWEFWKKLQKQVPTNNLVKAFKFVSKVPSCFANISKKQIEDLPETEGIFIFYDKEGKVLYVGDGKDIKAKVKTFYQKDEPSIREINIYKETYNIDCIETAGRIGRKLRKVQLVEQLNPIYDRKILTKDFWCLFKFENKDGIFRFKKKRIDEINIKEINNILGFYENERKMFEFLGEVEFKLKSNLIELGKLSNDKLKTSALDLILDKLNFLKQSKNNLIKTKYNIKFLEVFEKSRIKRWPFCGKIKVIEKDELRNIWEEIEIDDWCIVGNKNNFGNKLKVNKEFDFEIYKTLRKVLRDTKLKIKNC